MYYCGIDIAKYKNEDITNSKKLCITVYTIPPKGRKVSNNIEQ